jgi:hypothetical protein
MAGARLRKINRTLVAVSLSLALHAVLLSYLAFTHTTPTALSLRAIEVEIFPPRLAATPRETVAEPAEGAPARVREPAAAPTVTPSPQPIQRPLPAPGDGPAPAAPTQGPITIPNGAPGGRLALGCLGADVSAISVQAQADCLRALNSALSDLDPREAEQYAVLPPQPLAGPPPPEPGWHFIFPVGFVYVYGPENKRFLPLPAENTKVFEPAEVYNIPEPVYGR